MGESVSLKDIAKACNVSVSTVSKAMNDRADVSSAKKEEIRRVAREMNYVPNYMASALKNQYTRNIGVILAEEAGEGLAFFSGCLRQPWSCLGSVLPRTAITAWRIRWSIRHWWSSTVRNFRWSRHSVMP